MVGATGEPTHCLAPALLASGIRSSRVRHGGVEPESVIQLLRCPCAAHPQQGLREPLEAFVFLAGCFKKRLGLQRRDVESEAGSCSPIPRLGIADLDGAIVAQSSNVRNGGLQYAHQGLCFFPSIGYVAS